MLNQNAVAERVITLFNDIIKNDPTLGKQLFKQEWQCNTWTVDHDDIKVDANRNIVRMIGLLNGLIGNKPDGSSYIQAIYKNDVIVRLEYANKDKS